MSDDRKSGRGVGCPPYARSVSNRRSVVGRFSAEVLSAAQRHPYGVGGGVALVVGFFITIFVAFSAGSDNAPSAVQSALLVVATGGLQIAGAWLFNRQGSRAHPLDRGVHRVALRALSSHVQQVSKMRRIAEAAVDAGTAPAAKDAVQNLSVGLNYVQDGLERNVEDWAGLAPREDNEDGEDGHR